MKKILIALSGGVDSATAAYILKKKKYDVTAITLKLFESGNSKKALQDTKRICEILDMPLVVLDCSSEFKKQIIDTFILEYKSGRTPNPCILCNERIKFKKLLDYADSNNYDLIATGHYAKIEFDDKYKKYFLKAANCSKDQSYFLYRIKQDQLPRILFPLADMEKYDVRSIFKKLDIDISQKKDSQEVCFIPDNYKNFLLENKVLSHKGNFVDSKGNILGEHKGIYNYTIGQRKGLGISFDEPKFVIETNVENNTVTIGSESELFKRELFCNNVNLIYPDQLQGNPIIYAKIRSTAVPAKASFSIVGDDLVKITFEEPQRAITPGQSVVFYRKDIVLGGGIIK